MAASLRGLIVRPEATKGGDWCLGNSGTSDNSNHTIFSVFWYGETPLFLFYKKGGFPRIIGDFLM